MLAAARCLVLNTVLKTVRGTLDYSYGGDLYTKYGLKDDSGKVRPIGDFGVEGVLNYLNDLNLVSTCSGWSSIQTVKLNNQVLTSAHVPVFQKIFTLLPNLRPTTIELKGISVDDMAELVPVIQEIYAQSNTSKPKIIFTNVGGRTRKHSKKLKKTRRRHRYRK